MNKLGHLITGFIIGLLVIAILNYFFGWYNIFGLDSWSNWIIYIGIILVYSLLCDIDHKSGTITWWFIGLGIVGIVYSVIVVDKIIFAYALGLLTFTYIAGEFFSHRGFIHSILFGLVASCPLYYVFGLPEAVLAFLCFFSHLCADDEWFKLI